MRPSIHITLAATLVVWLLAWSAPSFGQPAESESLPLAQGEFARILEAGRNVVPDGQLLDAAIAPGTPAAAVDLLFLHVSGQVISVRVDIASYAVTEIAGGKQTSGPSSGTFAAQSPSVNQTFGEATERADGVTAAAESAGTDQNDRQDTGGDEAGSGVGAGASDGSGGGNGSGGGDGSSGGDSDGDRDGDRDGDETGDTGQGDKSDKNDKNDGSDKNNRDDKGGSGSGGDGDGRGSGGGGGGSGCG